MLEIIKNVLSIIKNILEYFFKWLVKDKRKLLPYPDVTFYTFKKDFICVEIRAIIVLNETILPSIDHFLDRITISRLFCENCGLPIDEINATWMADFAQIGFQCKKCNKNINLYLNDLKNDLYSDIRNNYKIYYDAYQNEINRLTKRKQRKYKLN